MGSIDTPRLYRKRCGTYFLRAIVATAASSGATRRKRAEVRLSLRTKNPGRARAIAAWANAKLEQALDMTDRRDILSALGGSIKTWSIGPDGISANGEEDTNALIRFMKE